MATGTGTESERRLPRRVLADERWLGARLDDPSIRIIEVDVSRTSYDEGHLPGAVLWNVYRDLKDQSYQLIDGAAATALLDRSSIEPTSTVVCYGYAAALGLWFLRLHGQRDVRLLNCSREHWRKSGLPWTAEAMEQAPTHNVPRDRDDHVRASRDDVTAGIGAPSTILLDVRTEAEYAGERFWPSGAPEPNGRAGHLPGARQLPVDGLLDGRGAFLGDRRLRECFAELDLEGDSEIITYCTIGGRAAFAWFVLSELLGRSNVRVYDGSWAEWGHLADAPIERSVGDPSAATSSIG